MQPAVGHLNAATPVDTAGRPITPTRLRRAMNLNIAVGAMGMAWYAVCSAQQVLQVFVKNHLNATDSQLGDLVAVAGYAAPFHLLAILIYGRLATRKMFWVVAHVLHRLLGFVLAAVAVYAQRGGDTQLGVRIIIWASAISWVLMTISAAGWWSWIADLIPQNIRGAFFGRRAVIVHGTNMLWFIAIQVCLDYLKEASTLYIYAVVFAIGGTLGVLDIVLHALIPEPARHPGELRIGWREFIEPLKNWNFVRFSVAIGLFSFAIGVFGPFLAPYITAPANRGGLGAPNVWLGIMFIINQTTWILTVTAWGIVMDRFGRKPTVVLGSLFPLAWFGYLLLTPSNYAYVLPLLALIGGIISPGYWNGVGQLMLTLTPQKNRTTYVCWHNVLAAVIASGGSVLGGRLKDAVADFHMTLGGIEVTSFHVVGLVSLALCVPCIILLSRIREGQERPVGFVVSRLATPGVFRTFMNLGVITSASDAARTARALRSFDGASSDLAVADIIKRLEDPDPEVREEAARALGRTRLPDAVDALMAQLRDPNSTIRSDAAQALGNIGDPRAVPALLEGLASNVPEVQDACARALRKIEKPRAPARSTRALRAIRDASDARETENLIAQLDDPDPEIREEAARALGRIGATEAVEHLLKRLRDPDAVMRADVAWALGRIGDQRAVPWLIEGLSDPSAEVQDACARALGEIGGHEAIRHLLRLLEEKHSERVIASGAEAVSKLGILEAAWEILPRLHATANPVLRRQLAIAMGNLLGRPGEFYTILTGETSQQGSRLGKLLRGAKAGLESFARPLPPGSRARKRIEQLADELVRIRGLMEAQAYRPAIEAMYIMLRQLVEETIDRGCPDDVALEYALARDVELGVGFWTAKEIRRLCAETDDTELLHVDALLILYFLSVYRLPAEPVA